MVNITCLNCKSDFQGEKSRKFCCSTCAALYNNKRRITSETTKQKISQALKAHYISHPVSIDICKKLVEAHSKPKTGRVINSIYHISSRTRTKLLKRLGIMCCVVCGWEAGTCDIHHIHSQIGNDHSNLTVLCPNHHRLAHEGLLDTSTLPTLEDLLPEGWRKSYYG